MTAAVLSCRAIEPDLVATAIGEAGPTARQTVEAHVAGCTGCRKDLERYRAIDGMVAELRGLPLPGTEPALARAELESRLADLRTRVVSFGIFPSPIGGILIGRSEHGISFVEYLEAETAAASRVLRLVGQDAAEDRSATEAAFRDILEYLEGRRTRLDWPLDLRWARSEFQRHVLEATARLPYGAVTSYAAIARQIGAPAATRAVAQALRRNPVPIAIPCHRIIGSSGELTGYAGNKVELKRRLLTIEGVHTNPTHDDYRVVRSTMYVRYQADTEYCLPTCGSLSSTPLADLTLFASRDRAESVGLAPCTSCRPDLNPLPA
jgi:methylated-DNA-[protein]-cysteine S-methyltransferase